MGDTMVCMQRCKSHAVLRYLSQSKALGLALLCFTMAVGNVKNLETGMDVRALGVATSATRGTGSTGQRGQQ